MSTHSKHQRGALLLALVLPVISIAAVGFAVKTYREREHVNHRADYAAQSQLHTAKKDTLAYFVGGITQTRPSAPGNLIRPDGFASGAPDMKPDINGVTANALCSNSQLCIGYYPTVNSSITPALVQGNGRIALDLLDPKGHHIWYITPRALFNNSKPILGDSSGSRNDWPRETAIETLKRLHAEKALISLRADPAFMPSGLNADDYSHDDVVAVFAQGNIALDEQSCATPQTRSHPNPVPTQAQVLNFARQHLEILPRNLPIKSGNEEMPRLLNNDERPTLFHRPFPPALVKRAHSSHRQLDTTMGQNGREGSCYNDQILTLRMNEVMTPLARRIAHDIYRSWAAFHEFPVFQRSGGQILLESDGYTPRTTSTGQTKTPPPFRVNTRRLQDRIVAHTSGAYLDRADRNIRVPRTHPNAFPIYGLPPDEDSFLQWLYGQHFDLNELGNVPLNNAKKVGSSPRPACPPNAAHTTAFQNLSIPHKWWACVAGDEHHDWLIDWFDQRLAEMASFRAAHPTETASIKLFEYYNAHTQIEQDTNGADIKTVNKITFSIRGCPNIKFTFEQNNGAYEHALLPLKEEGTSCF